MMAEIILSAHGRPGFYKSPDAQPIPIIVIIDDAASVLRSGRLDLITHRATATVARHVDPIRGAEIIVDGSVYAIVAAPVFSSVPGLIDLGVRRVSGPGVEASDEEHGEIVAGALAHDGEVRINGQIVVAQVNFAGEVLDDFGLPLQSLKTVVAIPVAVAAGVSQNDPVEIDGQTFRVDRLLRDGHGLVQLVLR